ncbi:conserved hypothetical protein [Ricinus communis]|uniref:Uncharacterized protein n=1 Tax=Ricinus communis TaxID=3988 RepID=B9SQE5_RICCO|nr:conserved hypothetical protein [Ricinus communis]
MVNRKVTTDVPMIEKECLERKWQTESKDSKDVRRTPLQRQRPRRMRTWKS